MEFAHFPGAIEQLARVCPVAPPAFDQFRLPDIDITVVAFADGTELQGIAV